jgi:hypothetical protein
MPEKTICPVSPDQFSESAQPITVDIGGNKMVAMPKHFSTGSLGFYATGKTVIEIGGVPCQAQVGVNITLVGSKPSEPTPAPAPAALKPKVAIKK